MSDPYIPVEGDLAPAFSLPASDGRLLGPKDFTGKWLVVYFYPKDSTSGCTTEAVEFSALVPEFEKLGASVVGVSRDSLGSHAKFIAKQQLTIPLLSDVGKLAIESYGAWREKTLYGKVSLGVVRSTFLIGPDGRVARAWPKVAKAAGHAQEVLEALRELRENTKEA
ncbi:alkyl hydroperoxide reductase/ Thiol specific antioxidant/ Mal allergen [Desulfovibrio sp. X2]|uniref:peroxiredoxin n=1 Tax=Desulfovibrio sp. X2 TaxID=941449 RepID=UPI000358E971|nr:peroxiredoxin [Desulfovibrio sp. X2]EPR41430.1 alkyl hydroperoxide reductase/ Thiol specific antioxidant/ Mal allergen [Desulfovibrio sp. X2]